MKTKKAKKDGSNLGELNAVGRGRRLVTVMEEPTDNQIKIEVDLYDDFCEYIDNILVLLPEPNDEVGDDVCRDILGILKAADWEAWKKICAHILSAQREASHAWCAKYPKPAEKR